MTDQESPVDIFKRATAAAVRAVASQHEIQIGFSHDPAGVQGKRVRLPIPARELDKNSVALVRGNADAAALWLRHHDATLHKRRQPIGSAARALFDALEHARCEELGARDMAGIARNLETLTLDRLRRKGIDHAETRDQLPLDEALRLMLREAITHTTPPPHIRKAVTAWQQLLDQTNPGWLRNLTGTAASQDDFARHSRHLIQSLDIDGTDAVSDEGDDTNDPDQEQKAEQAPKPESGDSQIRGDAIESEQTESDSSSDQGRGTRSESGDQPGSDGNEGELTGHDEPGGPTHDYRPNFDLRGDGAIYRVFTDAFDEVVSASSLCDADELSRLRGMMDQQLSHLQGMIARLANRLQRRLMARQTRSWHFDLEEGILDAARLSRIVVNPTTPLSFKQESETDFRDTVVTLLLDNSGSMRGRPIVIAALSADILARTLERCGVKVEILGFTTRAWKGGLAREQWVMAGKPVMPGRLNDLRHIIYKAADEPWRRARRQLGLMLREGILKENIDGEALLWAFSRLQARPEQRKIMMVISDGAPVDDSTLTVNPGHYLEQHLRSVIDMIENRSNIELAAIGIGHDVTRYYRRAVTITDVEQLGGTMMNSLTELFDITNPRANRVILRRQG